MKRLAILALASMLCAAAPALKKPPAPLDQLFAQLAKAQTPEDAKPIEQSIVAIFVQSGSPTADLLMARATAAHAAGDDNTAHKLFDAITAVAPDFAVGWHAMAVLDADSGDDEAALLELQKTVTLNPRQFVAMNELAQMLEEYGNKPAALALYNKALALDPQLEGVAKHIKALTRDVQGQGI